MSCEHLPLQKCMAGNDVSSLSDIELLAVVIGTGTRGLGAIDLAARLYSRFGGIAGIKSAGRTELAAQQGIGMTKGIRILSAIELGRRIIGSGAAGPVIDSPSKVWQLFLPETAGAKQAVFRAIVLNNKNVLIKKTVISIGTIAETIVHPREIFRDAIRESGSSIIIAHNHPSGVLTPSREDIEVTSRIAEAGKILGIRLVDHVIMSDRSYFSMREERFIES